MGLDNETEGVSKMCMLEHFLGPVYHSNLPSQHWQAWQDLSRYSKRSVQWSVGIYNNNSVYSPKIKVKLFIYNASMVIITKATMKTF